MPAAAPGSFSLIQTMKLRFLTPSRRGECPGAELNRMADVLRIMVCDLETIRKDGVAST